MNATSTSSHCAVPSALNRRCASLSALKQLGLAVGLCAMPLSNSFAVTVNYTHRVAYYTTWSDGGASFDQATEEIGQWANFSQKQAVAWRTYKTAGDNTGSARHLTVGDEFTIQVWASSAYGGFGVSLNSAGWNSGNWANRYSNSRVYLEADGNAGQWYVNSATGSVGFGAYVAGSTYKDYQLKVKITSENTVTVREISDAIWYTKFDCTLNGTVGTNISGYSVFLSDDWNGSGNANIYWKPTTKVENTGTVEFGGDDGDRTITGKISDGLAADSTATASANRLYKIGYGMITLSSGNTYSGGSEIQLGTLQISADDCLGTPPASATDNIMIWSTGSLRSSADFAIHANRSIALGDVNDPSIGVLEGTTLSYGGIMNGAADWNKKEAGTLVLSTTAGANTGKVTIQGGTLQINNDRALGAVPGTAAEKINIWSFGTFEAGDTFTLNANRSIALGDVSGPKISVTSGKTMTYAGAISGGASWSKEGAGTLTLSGINTYTGATTINAGTLAGAGSVASSAVTINSGAHIAPGTVVAAVTNIGNFSTGALTMNAGSRYDWQYDNTTSTVLRAQALSLPGAVRSVTIAVSRTGIVTYPVTRPLFTYNSFTTTQTNTLYFDLSAVADDSLQTPTVTFNGNSVLVSLVPEPAALGVLAVCAALLRRRSA